MSNQIINGEPLRATLSCLDRFNAIHAERFLEDISPDEIFHFLESVTQKLSKSTRKATVRSGESLL